MNRANQINGSIPVPALLLDGEDLVASQDTVGLYDGVHKSAHHQSGSIHVTSHRLLYIDYASPDRNSIALPLHLISESEHYAGFLRSSPKVTLFLNNNTDATPDGPGDDPLVATDVWVCETCDERNTGGVACSLCGMKRNSVRTPNRNNAHTPSPEQQNVCPACTFINTPFAKKCEICETPLASSASSVSASTSRTDTPEPSVLNPHTAFIKISFRQGGDKAFYTLLKRCLHAKAWVTQESRSGNRPSTSSASEPYLRSGIHGILQGVDLEAKTQEDNVSSALLDLEAFMIKARDMVALASTFNAKLAAQEEEEARLRATRNPYLQNQTSMVEPEEAKFIRGSLASLGLEGTVKAVTQDMVSQREWPESLAKELAGVLQGGKKEGLMKERGIVGLDEIWGSWNRARGVALLPPSTLLLALPYLPQYTIPPIRLRAFKSGLRVLHTPEYTSSAFTSRLNQLFSSTPESGGLTTLSIAQKEKMSIGLAQEMILDVEMEGSVSRDEIREGEIVWWPNVFTGYEWDGH
ncbi:Vps36-domain-containing protein [Sistotremastrum niveocremeum HHB9708]|uniref:Vacuolar protein-sorting-associated protein 36 n=1 Tax=Sistotremastrum niveocremeum HHB9708 TaxID=1314777 RepID=A0A164WTV5_9AGAM|nr:Vps36-domain-containing protein [Sistotremastrum niveocremeum HHB9708]